MYVRNSVMFLSDVWLVAVALLFPLPTAHAGRSDVSMKDGIPQAEAVVVADVKRDGLGATLTFREVLKGDPALKGQTFVLPQEYSFDRYTVNLKPRSKRVAMLLRKGWRTERWPAIEVFFGEDEFEALRRLVPIYELSNEQERLNALLESYLSAKTNNHIIGTLAYEFLDARDPSSLPVLTDIFLKVDLSYFGTEWLNHVGVSSRVVHGLTKAARLARQLGVMGDPRAVPALIEAMRSPRLELRRSAAQSLATHFPGAPGVTEAFRQALHTEGTDVIAARYLMKREPNAELETIIEEDEARRAAKWTEKERRSVRKRWVLEQGYPDAIKTYYLRTATDETLPDSERIVAAREVAGSLSVSEKDRLRASILPVVRKMVAEKAGYPPLVDAALVLRGVNHPDCRDLLIEIRRMQKPSSLCKASWIATAAIRELGPEERAREEKAWRFALPGPTTRDAKDEGRRLIKRLSAILEDEPGRKTDEIYWILYRLGDLEERRAVPVLLECLDTAAGWNERQMEKLLTEAFVSIGGSKVERAMKKMLPHRKEGFLMKLRGEESLVKLRRGYKVKRKIAFDVLWELRRERFLPELRRMVRRDDYGLKAEAIRKLRLIGTPEDLSVLLPLCDFWHGDRSLHSSAMAAVAAIRDRHNYDINGPISKK